MERILGVQLKKKEPNHGVVVIMIGRRVGKKRTTENEKKKKEKHILFISIIIPSIYHQRIARANIIIHQSNYFYLQLVALLAISIGLNRILEIDSSLGYTKYIICTSTHASCLWAPSAYIGLFIL